MALDGNERKVLYRNLINDPATQTETKKYSFTDWEKKLLGDEKAIGKLAQFSVGRNWAIDENDFVERYVPEFIAPPAPPTKKANTIPPVGIAAPVAEPAPSMTDISRQMAFQPPVQEPVEPIGVMAPPAAQGPTPSIIETAREMAFKPPVEPKKTPEQEWDEMSLLDKTGQTATEAISGFNRALLKTPSSMVKTASELGVGILNMLGGNMESEDAVLYSLADKYDKWLDTSETARKFVGKPEYTGLATDVGSGLGQIFSMIAAGPQAASKALLSTPTVLKAVSQKMFSKPSLIAFSQVFNSEFENMKAKGESEQTAFNQGLTNALATSPLENLPLINLAERLNKTIGVKLARRVLNAIQQGVEEGGQEAVQQVFSNLTNNQLVESEENIVDWAQGIQPSAEAGGVVGLLIGGLANAKAARKYSKKPATAPESDVVPAEEVQGTGRRVVANSIEEVPAEYRDKVMEVVSGPLATFGVGKKQYVYNVPTETIDITPPEAPAEETLLPEPTGKTVLIVDDNGEIIGEKPAPTEEDLTEDANVAPLTEEELAQIEETELTPEEEAALLAQEETAPVAPAEEEVVAAAPEQVVPAEEVVAAAPVTSKNVISKPATGKHSSPYKFETFELGANEKRGKSLGHGVYLAKPQESTASNFSNVSLKEGVSNFQDSVNSESEKKGYENYFNNPAVNVLREFGKKIITENGKVVMDVSGDIEQDVRAAAEEYNKKLGPIEKASDAKKKQYATEEDINNAIEFAKKHQDKLGAAYEYEMEYETDGYIIPDTTSKVAALPKEILNAISSFSPEAKALVDAAAKNNKATFQDLYNNLVGVKGLDSPKGVSDFLDSKGIIGQNDNGQILIYNDKKVNVISRKEVSYAEKGRELKASKPAPVTPPTPKVEPVAEKKEEKPAEETMPTAEFTSNQESSASEEFDGMKKPSKIKMKTFDGKHGKGAFERMQNITQNFEDIMDGLSEKIKQDCL